MYVPPGTIDFDLTAIPEPVQDASDCSLDQLPPEEEVDEEVGEGVRKRKVSDDITTIDIFHKKRVKGWWPVFSSEEGERELMVSTCIHTHTHYSHCTTHRERLRWRWRF